MAAHAAATTETPASPKARERLKYWFSWRRAVLLAERRAGQPAERRGCWRERRRSHPRR